MTDLEADRILKEQLNTIVGESTGKTIFLLRYVLVDILKAWERREILNAR